MVNEKKFKDYAEARNFSEPKGLSFPKHCKLCKEAVPKIALAFSNQAAHEAGYCCWMCCLSHLGDKKAYQILSDKAKENREKRMKL